MQKSSSLFLFLVAVMFLVTFHLTTAFIEATYTFGLLGVDVPPEIVFTLFLLTPVLLLAYPKVLEGKTGRVFTLLTGILALACWVGVFYLDTRGRMIAGGIGTGAALLFFPAFLRQRPASQPGLAFGAGLAFAVMAAILLRQQNFGSGYFPGQAHIVYPVGIVLATLVELIAWVRENPAPEPTPAQPTDSFWLTAGLCLGFSGLFLLLFFSFTSPVVMARWAGLPYLWVVGLASSAVGLTVVLAFLGRSPVLRLPAWLLLAWNAVFVLALSAAILPSQVNFPGAPTGYPLLQPASGMLGTTALVIALLLHPVVYADAALLLGRLSSPGVSASRLAGGMALAALFQLILIFGHIFTTVYDYIPVIGPLFRDRYWLVCVLPGLALLLAVFLAKSPLELRRQPEYRRWPAFSAIALVLFTLWMAARPTFFLPAAPGQGELRAMTYNIQQGYSAAGEKNFAGQLAAIRERQPDILGLQESDTARVAGGNTDVVRYLSENLGMNSYYGPNPITGTFGIALLSRYPIENPRTYFLYSGGEQTAVIAAEIHADGKLYTILVTHLGNGGPLIQQQGILSLLPGKQNVILMGDFNFRPGSEQYDQTVAVLQDGWLAASEKKINPAGQNLDRRIDHFFLSPNLSVRSAKYIGKGPSDHPGMFLEIPFEP